MPLSNSQSLLSCTICAAETNGETGSAAGQNRIDPGATAGSGLPTPGDAAAGANVGDDGGDTAFELPSGDPTTADETEAAEDGGPAEKSPATGQQEDAQTTAEGRNQEENISDCLNDSDELAIFTRWGVVFR